MVSNSSSENALSATIVVTFDAIVVLESTSQIPSLGFKYKYYDIFRHQPFTLKINFRGCAYVINPPLFLEG